MRGHFLLEQASDLTASDDKNAGRALAHVTMPEMTKSEHRDSCKCSGEWILVTEKRPHKKYISRDVKEDIPRPGKTKHSTTRQDQTFVNPIDRNMKQKITF